jgi:hypothetical protein
MISRRLRLTLPRHTGLAGMLMLTAHGAEPSALPRESWLIDPSPFKASVVEDSSKRTLVLENGLASRVIRLGPNAATVALDNLTTGEALLRAVAPEARVTIQGVEYPVGGLTGQPIQNYLKEEWISELKPIPGSYQFTRWEEVPVSKRLEWKKRPEWLARDHPWPPPGRHVVMHYRPPAGKPAKLTGKVLFEERFGAFSPPLPGWKITTSGSHPRSSWTNEGKSGEIFTPPDTAVFGDRPWPEGAASVELTLDAGDDTLSNAWGPGFALVDADGHTVHFIIRPNQQVFESPAGLTGRFDRGKAVRLRASLREGTVVLEAGQSAALETIATLPFPNPPVKLRVGKTGRDGKGGD